MVASEELQAQPQQTSLTAAEKPVAPTWDEIGESFETLGKVGLAMAIGFSAAGLFCRLAEQGKVKIPNLSSLLLPRSGETNPARSSKER